MMPGKNGELFTCMGSVVDREAFEQVMDDYYRERQWDIKNGLFTKAGLQGLALEDLIPEMEKKGFIVEASP
jgi:hypothetical protein